MSCLSTAGGVFGWRTERILKLQCRAVAGGRLGRECGVVTSASPLWAFPLDGGRAFQLKSGPSSSSVSRSSGCVPCQGLCWTLGSQQRGDGDSGCM